MTSTSLVEGSNGRVCLCQRQTLLERRTDREQYQEIVQEMDYSFSHPDIEEHEIIDILDIQIPEEE
jgi:hypothetical protein